MEGGAESRVGVFEYGRVHKGEEMPLRVGIRKAVCASLEGVNRYGNIQNGIHEA